MEIESVHHDNNSFCDQVIDATNWTDHKVADEFLHFALVEKIFVPIFFGIELIGNVAFLLVLARVKIMRTKTNFYLANLAADDVMTLCLETFG